MTQPSLTRIVLLVGTSGTSPVTRVGATESTPLTRLLQDGAFELHVVSLGSPDELAAATQIHLDPQSLSFPDRLLRALGGYRLRDLLERAPMGRLLNTLGPLAPSRVFWRTLRRHADAMTLLRSADVAIAADLETTKAAWIAVHRGWVREAYYDHRAVAALGQLPTI